MWEDIKPLLAELFSVASKAIKYLWTLIKWLAGWVAAAAIWLYEIIVLYFNLVVGLFTGHLYALGAMVIVLVIGYLVVNALQKRKSLVHIPWYKEPRNQVFILIPIITTFLAISTNTSMLDVSGGGRFFFEVFNNSPLLGPAGHLGVPTTIWALIFSFIFVVVAGFIALSKTERRKIIRLKKAGRRKADKVEQSPEKTQEISEEPEDDGEEAVILNEQPGWYERRKKETVEEDDE